MDKHRHCPPRRVEPLSARIVALVRASPGLTDREIASRLTPGRAQQPVNGACRRLAETRVLERRPRLDGRIVNYPPNAGPAPLRLVPPGATPAVSLPGSEDAVKRALQRWLEADGWRVEVAWGRAHGADVVATRGGERWVLEVKGEGSLSAMRVNFFLGALGETLQRMDDPAARYAVAFPDHPQYRGLWARLPPHAKARLGLTALFVAPDGAVDHVQA